MAARQPVHGTSLALRLGREWRGVLIMGPSGAGKSDLALRLIGRGGRLVADDYSIVWGSGGTLFATAPEAIAGRIEARGLGIVGVPTQRLTPVRLVIDCIDAAPERLPEPAFRTLDGLNIPLLRLQALHASAPDLALRAMAAL